MPHHRESTHALRPAPLTSGIAKTLTPGAADFPVTWKGSQGQSPRWPAWSLLSSIPRADKWEVTATSGGHGGIPDRSPPSACPSITYPSRLWHLLQSRPSEKKEECDPQGTGESQPECRNCSRNEGHLEVPLPCQSRRPRSSVTELSLLYSVQPAEFHHAHCLGCQEETWA